MRAVSRFSLLCSFLLLSACAGDTDPLAEFGLEDERLISFEVVPSAQADHWGNLDLSATSYDMRATASAPTSKASCCRMY